MFLNKSYSAIYGNYFEKPYMFLWSNFHLSDHVRSNARTLNEVEQ